MSEISSNRDAVSTNSRIDRVRNHADERLGTMGGDGDGDVAHDARVDGEQIVTGHSGLSKGGTPSAPIARCQLSRRAARVSGVLFRPSARVLRRNGDSSPLCRITPSRLGGVRTFLGMPAGMTTMSAPVRASLRPSSSRVYPVTTEGVSTCEMSAATPLTTGTMSYRARVRIAGDCLSRSAKGCPIPGERERVSRYDAVRTTSSADESDLESHFDVGREKGRTDFAAHSPP